MHERNHETIPTMTSVNLTIDGRLVLANADETILEAARRHGIDIPTLCFHEALPTKGSCWLCIVEIKGKNRFIPACSTKVSEGMVVETSNGELAAMRRQSLERIIAMHCGDCFAPCELACPAGCDSQRQRPRSHRDYQADHPAAENSRSRLPRAMRGGVPPPRR
jgi:glutamate synthase (NADPH/NADH) small chain